MCKVAAFYEGGLPYPYLEQMPLKEFFAIVDCSNTIAEERWRQMEKQRGK